MKHPPGYGGGLQEREMKANLCTTILPYSSNNTVHIPLPLLSLWSFNLSRQTVTGYTVAVASLHPSVSGTLLGHTNPWKGGHYIPLRHSDWLPINAVPSQKNKSPQPHCCLNQKIYIDYSYCMYVIIFLTLLLSVSHSVMVWHVQSSGEAFASFARQFCTFLSFA